MAPLDMTDRSLPSQNEKGRGSPFRGHVHQVKKAKGALHISRGGLEEPLPRSAGKGPLQSSSDLAKAMG